MKKNANVYVMTDGTSLKVGHSIAPQARAKQLGSIDILHLTDIIVEAEAVERTAHRLLKMSGKHLHGEWFSASLEEAVEAIERARRIVDGLELPLDKVPPTRQPQINIRVSAETMDKIDRLRRISPIRPIPSASEIVRLAIDEYVKKLERDGARS